MIKREYKVETINGKKMEVAREGKCTFIRNIVDERDVLKGAKHRILLKRIISFLLNKSYKRAADLMLFASDEWLGINIKDRPALFQYIRDLTETLRKKGKVK